jgi:hypothetical protein
MLVNVPQAINRMARNVVINHPNTWNCQIFRKTVHRIAPIEHGGLPTLGGLAVLDTTDEEDITWDFIGNGFALNAEQFQPAPILDRRDGNIGASAEFRFMIEPEEEFGFDVKSKDIFYLLIWTADYDDPARMAFEVVGIETSVNIPPFVNRYVANRRDDLHIPAQ